MNIPRGYLLILSLAVSGSLAAAPGCSRSPASSPPATPARTASVEAPAAPAHTGSTRLLEELSLLAIGRLPSAEQLAAARADGFDVARFIDRLLEDPSFAGEVAPSMILRQMHQMSNTTEFVANSLDAHPIGPGGELVYHLREPCKPEEAVRVRPWWALDTTVLVCPDSYRPEVRRDAKAKSYCIGIGALAPHPDAECGCGEYLLNCVRDPKMAHDFAKSLFDETNKTIAHVVAHDLPAAKIFTANEAFRDRNAHAWYLRGRMLNGNLHEPPDVAQWPAEGTYAPRAEDHAGQHAGILTTSQVEFFSDEPLRPRMKYYYDLVWCKGVESVDVTADKILDLNSKLHKPGANLREGDGWELLAGMPVCTTCHARLDYGARFFWAHPAGRVSTQYVRELQLPGSGMLYANDLHDPRTEGELTPRSFAEIAVRQPEFAQCMVKDVSLHVLGDQRTADDVDEMAKTFAREGTIKGLTRVALLRYAAHRAAAAATARADVRPAGTETRSDAPRASAARDVVHVSPKLRAMLEEHCVDCHAEGQSIPSFVNDDQSRAMAIKMLDQVAFARMPKRGSIVPAARAEMVRELIATVWTDEQARRDAARYFGNDAKPLAVFPLATGVHVVDQIIDGDAVTPAVDGAMIERGVEGDLTRFTPGFAATLAAEGLAACKKAGRGRGADLEKCLDQALDAERWIHGAKSE